MRFHFFLQFLQRCFRSLQPLACDLTERGLLRGLFLARPALGLRLISRLIVIRAFAIALPGLSGLFGTLAALLLVIFVIAVWVLKPFRRGLGVEGGQQRVSPVLFRERVDETRYAGIH